MSAGPKAAFAADYVTVAERIASFYEKHPDGSLQSELVELNESRVVMRAYAYRSPTDERPGIGYSSLEIPGRTPYTRGSEIENCETSAWGRAIAALGFDVKRGVATRDEIANKAAPDGPPPRPAPAISADGSLIGEVERGRPPVDLSKRQTPDGPIFGFKLKAGSKAFQVVASGPLADALELAGLEVGVTATVWGPVELVPWEKDGKAMPPYARIALERISTADFTLPDPTEAPSEGMFTEADMEEAGL